MKGSIQKSTNHYQKYYVTEHQILNNIFKGMIMMTGIKSKMRIFGGKLGKVNKPPNENIPGNLQNLQKY